MTPPVRAVLPTFQQELDPLLLMPVRLFIACLLADGEWSDDIAVRSALQLGDRSFVTHVECLRAAGYLEVRTQGDRKKLRLTSLGGDRFAEHVGALSRVTFAAVKLLPTARRSRSDDNL
ncbi:transcriptional regulator [Amycolatopsis sp. NPDC098790]|uniref:transcriptional regulator n=1 Tax=Amycolatopsis sp. NPDC098790 TaxID=3363939 RepID=UPI003820CAEA